MKILLGIQPTGRLHIGNYFGALKKGLEMKAEGHDVMFLCAQYHANSYIKETAEFCSNLVKLGVGGVYKQTPETLELFYQLAHSTTFSELARLPQYQTSNEAKRTLHMLSYPLLMAADIIISDCDAVIVGDDQEPHLHFYREIARRNGYKEAVTIKSDTPRIMSIKQPRMKMSKSLGDSHCIYLDETIETLTPKIMGAPTDREGLDNLKLIASLYGIQFEEERAYLSKISLIQTILNYNYSICV